MQQIIYMVELVGILALKWLKIIEMLLAILTKKAAKSKPPLLPAQTALPSAARPKGEWSNG